VGCDASQRNFRTSNGRRDLEMTQNREGEVSFQNSRATHAYNLRDDVKNHHACTTVYASSMFTHSGPVCQPAS
jgi:hypothetical protein